MSQRPWSGSGGNLGELEAEGRVSPPCRRGVPAADAYWVPAERNPHAPVGRRGPRSGGVKASGHQDRITVRGAISSGKKGPRCRAPVAGQPVGDCRSPPPGATSAIRRPVTCGSGAGRARRRADPRPSTHLRLAGTRAGGEPNDDRKTLLGHRKVQTTARRAHLARESVKMSTARVAESIAANM